MKMARSLRSQFLLLCVAALVLSSSLNLVFVSVLDVSHNAFDSHLGSSITTSFRQQQNEGFAACLMVMDENHRLTEWLAYHSHVLPLEYLVVGVDPNSKTSPTSILTQWRDYGITIVEWNNTDIFNGMNWEYDNIVMKRKRAPHDHRQRQNMFLRNCIVHMRENNRTWVLMTDVDEFLLINDIRSDLKNSTESVPTTSINHPPISEKGSIMKFIQQEQKKPNSEFDSVCLGIPRILFGTNESSPTELAHKHTPPPGFDELDTIHYRKHLRRGKSRQKRNLLNGWGKVMIDVSRLNNTDIPSARQAFKTMYQNITVHRPLPNVCPPPFITDADTIFRINHYVGSWESFSYRQDPRESIGRNEKKWRQKAAAAEETDDDIRDWLGGFVEDHGMENATRMLRNVGVFKRRISNIV